MSSAFQTYAALGIVALAAGGLIWPRHRQAQKARLQQRLRLPDRRVQENPQVKGLR